MVVRRWCEAREVFFLGCFFCSALFRVDRPESMGVQDVKSMFLLHPPDPDQRTILNH